MALIVAFVVAVIATPVAAWFATRVGLVDHPGPLKVQRRPVPYLGGVAVLLALAGPVAWARPSMLVPLVLAGVLGVADDATDLSPGIRVAVEIAIGLAVGWVMAPHNVGYLALSVLVVLVLVNAVNLLDGLDGLAAGVVAVGAFGFFVVCSGSSATLAVALYGALAGFLVWNVPPARVYLGDAGSYVLGAALAMLFVAAAQLPAPSVSAAFLFVGVPVADATVAIVRRLRARTPLWRGDRGHVYDQLVDRGWSPTVTVCACVGAQAAFTAAGIGIANLSGAAAVVIAVIAVAVVGAGAIAAFTSPRAWTPDH